MWLRIGQLLTLQHYGYTVQSEASMHTWFVINIKVFIHLFTKQMVPRCVKNR